MVSLYKLFVHYLNLTSTGSTQDSSYSLQCVYNRKATPTKGIIKTSPSPITLLTDKIIVSSPIPFTKITTFSTKDHVISFKDYTPPKQRTIATAYDFELTTLEIQFQMIISFEYTITRQYLITFRHIIQSFLQRYESHIIQNKLTDPHTVRNLVLAISLWDKITVLKNLIKSSQFNQQLDALMGIPNKDSRVYMEAYDFVYDIFENEIGGMDHTQYYSYNLVIYLSFAGVETLWKQSRG